MITKHTSKKPNFQDCRGVFFDIFDFNDTKELIFHGELDNYHDKLARFAHNWNNGMVE